MASKKLTKHNLIRIASLFGEFGQHEDNCPCHKNSGPGHDAEDVKCECGLDDSKDEVNKFLEDENITHIHIN